MFEEEAPKLSEQPYYPEEESIYIPVVKEPLYLFIKKLWHSMVNKMVSIEFANGDYCFDHSLFEVIDGDTIKVAAISSQIRLDDIAQKKIPEEFKQFIKAVNPYALNGRSYTSHLIREAIVKTGKGELPPIDYVDLKNDDKVHPRIKELLTETMNYAVCVPLFFNNSPIGVLWGVCKEPLSKIQLEILIPQLHSFTKSISTIISLEVTKKKPDIPAIRRTIEKIDTTSLIKSLLYTKQKGQQIPIRTIFGWSIRYQKNFRLDASYIIPTSKGFSISLKSFLPEQMNNSGKTLLMIPGFFCRRSVFDLLAREMCFKYGYKVISMDLRGRSSHTMPKGMLYEGWSLDQFINDDFPAALSWVRTQYPNDQIVVYGHSMGGMIARFYTAAFQQIRKKTMRIDLPDPMSHIAGIVSIASPDYISYHVKLPGYKLFKMGFSAFSKVFLMKYFGLKLIDQFLTLTLSSVVPTINLQKYFSMFNSINLSMRQVAYNLSAKILTLKDFIGYPQVTPPEIYLLMEDIICEESTMVTIQLIRSLLTDSPIKSFDGTINYHELLNRHFSLPHCTIYGTEDAIVPHEGFETTPYLMASDKSVMKSYQQGHLGIMMHPETVRSLARYTDNWIKTL